MTVTIAKWSLDDYHRMIEVGILTGRQVELLNGQIINMSPERLEHAQTTTDAADYLREILGTKALVRDAKPITIPESNSEPEPDLAIVQPNRSVYRVHHPYPENIFWLIEYSQTSLSKDLEIKRTIYAYALIPEYWVVDLNNQQVTIFREPIDGDYRLELTLKLGEISPLAFPDIGISIQRLFQG